MALRTTHHRLPLVQLLTYFDRWCQNKQINHRFVGGVSFGGLLTSNTTWSIDIARREVRLYNPQQLSPERSDGSIKDVDVIILNPISHALKKELRHAWESESSRLAIRPPLSCETAIFSPIEPNRYTQFVTNILITDGKPYLQFHRMKQEISWQSLESWTVHYGKYSYTVRNPIADWFAYQFRNPGGVKDKDQEKLALLKKLAESVVCEGKKLGIDYLSEAYFLPWEEFTNRLSTSTSLHIRLKRFLTRLYWSTVGEYIAHGRGLSKPLQKFSDKLTG